MTMRTPQMAKKSRDDDMTSTTEGLKEAVARRVYSAMVGAAGYARGTRPIPKWVIGGNSIAQDDARAVAADILSLISSSPLSTGLDEEGWVLVPREAAYEQLRAMSESRAVDDEGPFPPLHDLLDFSGENKVYTVLRAAYRAALSAAPATVLSEGGRDRSAATKAVFHRMNSTSPRQRAFE